MKGKLFITLAVASALSLSLVDCGSSTTENEADQNTSAETANATAGAGAITFSYPKDWILQTEADLGNLEEMQILGQTPTAISNVGPKEDVEISLGAFYVPDFEYSYDEFKEYAGSSKLGKADIVTIGDHEAIELDLSNETVVSIILIPNIDGKITSIFAASYPSGDEECSAVVDSVTVS